MMMMSLLAVPPAPSPLLQALIRKYLPLAAVLLVVLLVLWVRSKFF